MAVLVVLGLAIRLRSQSDQTSAALDLCNPALARRATKDAVDDREEGERILDGAGSPSSVVEIADWDPGLTWAFRSRDDYVVDEGLYQAPDKVSFVRSELTRPDHPDPLQPSQHVFIGREVWEQDPNVLGGTRDHCEMAPEYVMVMPMHAVGAPGPGTVPPGTPTSGHAAIALRPGVRLRAEPGKPTTVDGEPGTAYSWSPAEDPWLRAEFVLDGRNQLRSATITDTARNEVVGEFSARPTDARIEPPDWTG